MVLSEDGTKDDGALKPNIEDHQLYMANWLAQNKIAANMALCFFTATVNTTKKNPMSIQSIRASFSSIYQLAFEQTVNLLAQIFCNQHKLYGILDLIVEYLRISLIDTNKASRLFPFMKTMIVGKMATFPSFKTLYMLNGIDASMQFPKSSIDMFLTEHQSKQILGWSCQDKTNSYNKLKLHVYQQRVEIIEKKHGLQTIESKESLFGQVDGMLNFRTYSLYLIVPRSETTNQTCLITIGFNIEEYPLVWNWLADHDSLLKTTLYIDYGNHPPFVSI